ncbi:uncharacterized protein LOC102458380 [Pelodiscus sinensis]|uniref:uncharacterized protein LOC102458380 n=1 Tax=Pelodiscus sinensis TaxID=13735 RepID=UPI003F6BD261
MMQVPMINHGAGPPNLDDPSGQDTTRAPLGRRGAMRVTPGPAAALMPARGHGWQIILAMVTCFLASTTACNKGSSVSPCQNPLATVPTSSPLQPDLVVSQNNTGSILMTPSHHVLNYMEKRHTGLHAVQEEPHTRSLQADSAAPTDQLRLPEATWNDLSLFSALFAFTLDGRASLDYKPGAAEDQHGINLSTLKLDTSLALGAQAKITGSPKLSPKGLQASSKGDLRLPSLQASKVAIEAMDSNAEVVPANISELMVLGTDTSTMHYDPLHSTPKASAQPLRASPDAVSLARLSPSSGTKQPAAADSLTSEAWGLYKTTHSAMPMAPSTSRDQKATKTSATVLLKLLPSPPQTYRASKEPSYLMSLITSSTLPTSPAAAPTQSNLTLSTHLPDSMSPLEVTSSGPAELITHRRPGSSLKASGEAARVEPVWLSTVPGTQPVSLPASPSRESSLEASPTVTMSTQGHSSTRLSDVTKFTWSASASMSQSTNLPPAPGSMRRPTSTSASVPLHVGDLSHFTEHPSLSPLTVPDTLAGPTEGVGIREMLTAVTPPVSELPTQPALPIHVSPTAQLHAPSGASASPLKVALEGVVQASSEVPSGLPLQSGGGTTLPTALPGHRGTRPHRHSVPKPATAGLGHLLTQTPSSPGISNIPVERDTLSSPVLEMTTPESSSEQGLLGVPHSPVTRSRSQSDAVVSDISQLTDAITNAPLLAATGIGLYEAIHPYEPLKIDVETASTSPGRTHPVRQLGTRPKEHMTEVISGSTNCPVWESAALSTAVEEKGSPNPAVTHAHDYLIIVPSSLEPMRGTSGSDESPLAGTSQALTYPAVTSSVKPTAAFLHEDTAAYSPPHMLPISTGPRTQSSTAACCPETSPSVSGGRTAANITSAILHGELAETVTPLMKEQTEVPPGSSELPLSMSSGATTTELLSRSSSAKPLAQPARKPYSLRRPGMRREPSTPADLVLSHSTTSLPSRTALWRGPQVPTSPQRKTVLVLPSKNDTSGMVETHSTSLYLNRTGHALLAAPTPTALEHTQRPVPAASARAAPSEWKPTSAMLGKHKVKEVSTKAANISGVTPPALGRTSISTAVSKATPAKTRTAASLPLPPAQRTAQLTNLPLTSGPKAPVFQPLAEAKPSGVTSLHTAARIPPTAKRTALLTSARTPATPGLQLPILPKPTQLMPWNRSNAPTPLRLPTSVLSTRLLLSSRHGSTAKTGLHVLTRTMAARQNLATAAATAKRVATIEKGHTSKLESKASKPSFSPKPKSGPASRPKSPVHILPLQFRLLGAAYTELLKNKYSDVYKKLEKEVKLTLNKMFSNYKNFLQVNILQFLNGSVIVESEALFQEDGPAPTNSDLIRTVVTEVERKMDTFYDWRVDVTSVRSNGFSLENLEPEKLLVSFTALRLGSIAAFGGVRSQGPLDQLNDVVVQSLGTLYKVKKFSIVRLRDIKGDLEISGEAYVDTQAHADISQILQALRALVNYSVDLTTLSVADARLNLQVFPISFLINNWMVDEKLLDHSSVEHQSVTRSLADVLTHTLRKYQSLLQVVIRDLLSGSLSCHGDVVFQHPAPSSADVLQTLLLSVGPDDMLAGSGFQVDPYSFHVAGDTLEPPFMYPSFPGYGVAIIIMCGLVVAAIPIMTLLYLNSGLFGWHHTAIIQGGRDPEAGTQTFELDNKGFRSAIEEDEGRHSYTPKHSAGD